MKFLIYLALLSLSISISNTQDPTSWAQTVFSMLQAHESANFVDYVFVTKSQLKSIMLEEMKATNYQGELSKKIEDEEYLIKFYEKMKADFVQDLKSQLLVEKTGHLSQATLDSITYDYVLPKYQGPDIEIPWPASKTYEIDTSVRTLAQIRLYYLVDNKPYVLHLTPTIMDGQWRLIDANDAINFKEN